ncbi:Nesprin-1 [Operophtera brumata]|uniref:Nesprin-1 n=1 Tax=Operophtera brumata TaxID=104452 RepID=A0A0L7LNR0_OPEBR|nr:Nesprin-1 [Operophtera brumata]
MLFVTDEQERVQKKTFVNWINSHLSKRIPPMRIDDLIYDLRDGTKLLALLEVLSGEKLVSKAKGQPSSTFHAHRGPHL